MGFHGGNSIWELGSPQDMVVFFACLDYQTRSTLAEAGRFVLLDRLFKRYLRLEDLDEAVSAMKIAKEQFRLVTVEDSHLIELGLDKDNTALRLEETNLAKMFAKYFDALPDCVRSYRSGKRMFGYYYNPVKVSRVDLPGFTEENARPTEAYDELVAPPYWFP